MTKRKPVPSKSGSGSLQTTDSAGVSSGVQSPSLSQFDVDKRQESDSAVSANFSELVQPREDVPMNDDSLISLEDSDSRNGSLPPPLPPRGPQLDRKDGHAVHPPSTDVLEHREDVPRYPEMSIVEEPTSIEMHPEKVGPLGAPAETDFGDWEENAPESPMVDEEDIEGEIHEHDTTQPITILPHEDRVTDESKDVVQIASQNSFSTLPTDLSIAEHDSGGHGKGEEIRREPGEETLKATSEEETLKPASDEEAISEARDGQSLEPVSHED